RWAETGNQGLAEVAGWQPHLLILDIRLPDLNGYDVCRRLRAEGNRPPILMLTARDDEVDKVLGLELGADDYMVKPYSLRELLSRVRALLRRAYGELAPVGGAAPIVVNHIEIDPDRMLVRSRGEVVELTPT